MFSLEILLKHRHVAKEVLSITLNILMGAIFFAE